MKTTLAILMSLALVTVSFAMEPKTVEINRVLDQPSRDTKDMVLKHKETEEILHVERNAALSGHDFKEVTMVERIETSVLVTLTDEGGKKFAELTKEMVHKRLAITFNNRLLSAPFVNQQITGGSFEISGNFTKEEVEEMIAILKKGKEG